MSQTPWIGVDLDGTLADNSQWLGVRHIGAPIMPMVERIRNWLRLGILVKIMTARMAVDTVEEAEAMEILIQTWLREECGLPALECTCAKDYAMIELWDDRAVRVERNTGKPIGYLETI